MTAHDRSSQPPGPLPHQLPHPPVIAEAPQEGRYPIETYNVFAQEYACRPTMLFTGTHDPLGLGGGPGLFNTHDRLPADLAQRLRGADEIWHLGDVCAPGTLVELELTGADRKSVV